MGELVDVFLHEKPYRILTKIRTSDRLKYASILSRDANCTYSHTVKLLGLFEETGLVVFHKRGRKKLVELTAQGEKLVTLLEQLVGQLSK